MLSLHQRTALTRPAPQRMKMAASLALAGWTIAGWACAVSTPARADAALPATQQSTASQQLPAPPAPVKTNALHGQHLSPTLVSQPDVAAVTQNLYLSGPRADKLRIHQGDWGVFNRDGGAASGFGPVGRYGVSRWAEDWSVLRDPAARAADKDPFDALKYIPLNQSGSVYLTLSGEERLRNWFENRPSLGTKTPNDSGRMTLRSIYGADLHTGEHLRFYGEIINASAGGWNAYGYNAGYRTKLDLLQGFVEAKGNLFGAKTGVMVGRMQFLDAPNYVFYARTVSSVPESWNGVRGYAFWPRLRLDVFDFVQTDITPQTMFRDRPDWGTRLYGAYASYAVPDFKFLGGNGQVFLDAFYYGYIFRGASAALPAGSATMNGSTQRDNYGLRASGKAGPIEFSFGGIYQGGRFYESNSTASRPVSAFALNESVGWRFAKLPGHPLLGLQADWYSGGNNSGKGGTVGTYMAPYVPSSYYLDETSYLGPSNVIAIAPKLNVALGENILLNVKVPVYWRANTNDGVYSTSSFYSLKNVGGGYIGTAPQLSLTARIGRHLTWQHDLARFFVSNAMARAKASDSTYYLSTLTFTF